MAGLKRSLAAAIVTVGLATATFAVAAPVSAAPYVKAPSLAVISTTPCKVTPFTVTGSDFVPASTVSFTLAGFSLGSVTVGAGGGFQATVTLPDVTGTFDLVAAGTPTATDSNTASATLTLQNCPVVVPVTG